MYFLIKILTWYGKRLLQGDRPQPKRALMTIHDPGFWDPTWSAELEALTSMLYPHAWVLQHYLLFYFPPTSGALDFPELISTSVIGERAMILLVVLRRGFVERRWRILLRLKKVWRWSVSSTGSPNEPWNQCTQNTLVLCPWPWLRLLFLSPPLLFKFMVSPSSPTQLQPPQESNPWQPQENTPPSSGLHFVLAINTELTW